MSGEPIDTTSGGDPRFAHLVDAWLDTQRSVNTRAAYAGDLAVFGRWCLGQDALPLAVTTSDVVRYQAACEAAGESPSTIRRRSSALSSFFQFAVANEAAPSNPVTASNRPLLGDSDASPTPSLPPGVVRDYLSAAADRDARLHALVALLALDGLKLNEALALDVGDVDPGHPTSAVVARQGGHRRVVLHRESASAVRRCVDGRPSGPLLVSAAGTATAPRRLTRFGADHLIKRLPPHDGTALTANALRRFYVTSSHAAGVELDDICDRAGLSDVRSASRYLAPTSPSPTTTTNTNQPAGSGSGRRPSSKEV